MNTAQIIRCSGLSEVDTPVDLWNTTLLRHHLDHHGDGPASHASGPSSDRFVSHGHRVRGILRYPSSAMLDARLTGWDQPRISRRDGAKRCPTVVRTHRLACQPTLMKVALQGHPRD